MRVRYILIGVFLVIIAIIYQLWLKITEFEAACGNGDIKHVKALLRHIETNPTTHENRPIRLAASNGHLDIVRLLLKDRRVDPSAVDNFAIRFAYLNGHTNVVLELLQDKRVDPTVQNNWLLRLANIRKDFKMIEHLQSSRPTESDSAK